MNGFVNHQYFIHANLYASAHTHTKNAHKNPLPPKPTRTIRFKLPKHGVHHARTLAKRAKSLPVLGRLDEHRSERGHGRENQVAVLDGGDNFADVVSTLVVFGFGAVGGTWRRKFTLDKSPNLTRIALCLIGSSWSSGQNALDILLMLASQTRCDGSRITKHNMTT